VSTVFGHATRTAGYRERMRQWHVTAREMALALIARAAENGLPCPSNDAMQGALGCSRPQLYAVLAALEATGKLQLIQRGGPRTTRVYFVPEIGKATADGAASLAPKARVHLAPTQQPPPAVAAAVSSLSLGAAGLAERTRPAASFLRQPITPARTCQWIHVSGAFCGHASVPGHSWCDHHLRRVFVQRPDPQPDDGARP
jgi:hypothetical protein